MVHQNDLKLQKETAASRVHGMNISDHYRKLIKRSSEALEDMLNDGNALMEFTKVHNFLKEFEMLHETVQHRPESQVLELALREYQFALYAVAASKYRHASTSLRLFLELALSSVFFSAYEIKLRNWLNNKCDVNWASVVNKDDGVFSSNFISAFNPDLAQYGPQYSALSGQVYRECSEFVHGNPHTHSNVSQSLNFDQTMLLAWTGRAEAAKLGFLFSFTCRYLNIFSDYERNYLEDLIMHTFGYMPAVQDIYSGTTR